MSYIEQSLSTGEKVEALFKLHWFAWIPMGIWIILGLITLGLTWGPKDKGTFCFSDKLTDQGSIRGLTDVSRIC